MTESISDAISNLIAFLRVPTPKTWLEHALTDIKTLLIDHAHCERKAAMNALNLISKYPGERALIRMMSPLAREELLHLEKVMDLLDERHIRLIPLAPSAYAQTLQSKLSKKGDLSRLQDELILGAIIEARSCERFSALVPYLEDRPLAKFYTSLIKAEARHFQDYLTLADSLGPNIMERSKVFLDLENELILGADKVFRFHSGVPTQSKHF